MRVIIIINNKYSIINHYLSNKSQASLKGKELG